MTKQPMILTEEMERIVSLPIWDPVDEETVEALSRELIQAGPYSGQCPCLKSCRGQPMRLKPEQAAGVVNFRKTGRGFASIPVGQGKTALSILLASEAFKLAPDARILLLLPAHTCKQFLVQDVPWSRTHLVVNIPRWINLYKASEPKRQALAASPGGGLFICPQSLLSEEDARSLLERIDADFVIVDEAHFLKGRASARNRRFWDWVRAVERADPDGLPPAGVVMSGTIQTNTPANYHAIMRWTLGPLSVLPTTVMESMEWSAILRAGSDSKRHVRDCDRTPGCDCPMQPYMSPEQYATMEPLIRWARANFPDEAEHLRGTRKRVARRAYRLRLRSAPGVIPMSRNDLGVSLQIENVGADAPGNDLQELIDEMDRSWTSPDGDVLTYGIEKHQVMSQLTAGFYLKHTWPEKHPLVRQAIQAHEAKQEYLRDLRRFFASADARKQGIDTPRQAGKWWSTNGPLKRWGGLYDLWLAWKDLQAEGLPEREVTLVMVDNFKVKQVLQWAKKVARPGGIVWVEHSLFGDEVFRQLRAAGLRNVLRKREGDDWLQNDGTEESICVANRRAHGVGKNLQHFRHQIIAQWCRSAPFMEQLLGRVHRQGQQADEIVVHVMNETQFDHMNVAATLLDTVYDQQTLGGSRKLLVARWEPLPVDYPPDFLRERGFVLAQDRREGVDVDEEEEED